MPKDPTIAFGITQTGHVPYRLATNDLGAGEQAELPVCTRIIAERRPIPVHSFGQPCWRFGRPSHQFWRGTFSESGRVRL